MRSRELSLVAVLGGIALPGGCSLFTSFTGLSDEYGTSATSTGGASNQETGGTGGTAGGTGGRPRIEGNVKTCDPVSLLSPSWAIRTDTVQLANQYFVLTQNAKARTGGLWWKDEATFDAFEVSFEFRISPTWNSFSGSGFTFAWTKTSAPPGDNYSYGRTLGLPQVPGWALALDTAVPATFPFIPKMLLVDGTSTALANSTQVIGVSIADKGFALDANWVSIRLTFDGNNFSIYQTDDILISATVNGYKPFSGYWGFTASTDNLYTEQHAIRNVRMFFPYNTGCIK